MECNLHHLPPSKAPLALGSQKKEEGAQSEKGLLGSVWSVKFGVDRSLGGGLRSGGGEREKKEGHTGRGGEKTERVLVAKIGYSFRAVILEAFQPQGTSAKSGDAFVMTRLGVVTTVI